MTINLNKKAGTTDIYQKMISFETCSANNYLLTLPKYCVTSGSQITVTMSNLSDTATVTSSTPPPTFGTPIFVTPISCATGDDQENNGEGDGVCDSWEKGSTLEIPATGGNYIYNCNPACDSSKDDIFVEVDYMTGHRPTQKAIDAVIAAFDAKNIRLHVQIDDDETAINHSTNTPFGGPSSFDAIKAEHFGTPSEREVNWSEQVKSKRQVFHYVLFAHSQANSASGIAEYLGNDAMITLGTFDGQIGHFDQQAGTFMHELGHNLNLDHDGDPTDGLAINCIPNYLSVMNYAYQTNDLIGGLTTWRPLDFSRMEIPTGDPLVEDNLNEADGVTNYSPRPNAKMIWNKNPLGDPISVKTGVTGSNVEWNGISPNTQTGIKADLNNLGTFCGSPSYQSLQGYNDWENIKLKFKDNISTFGDGVGSTSECKTLPPQAANMVPNDLTKNRFCADKELTSAHVNEIRDTVISFITNFEANQSAMVKSDTAKLKDAIRNGDMDTAQDLLERVGLSDARGQAPDDSLIGTPEPIDSDGDGIPDERDGCPTTPENFNGYQDTDGCPDELPPPPVVECSSMEIREGDRCVPNYYVSGLIGLIVGLAAMAGYFAYAHNKPRTNRRN